MAQIAQAAQTNFSVLIVSSHKLGTQAQELTGDPSFSNLDVATAPVIVPRLGTVALEKLLSVFLDYLMHSFLRHGSSKSELPCISLCILTKFRHPCADFICLLVSREACLHCSAMCRCWRQFKTSC